MPVLEIFAGFMSKKESRGRAHGAAQAAALDAKNQWSAKSSYVVCRFQRFDLLNELPGKNKVCVEGHDPRRLDASLRQAEVPLLGVSVESAKNDACLWERPHDFQRVVVTGTVDDDNVTRPIQLREG